MKCRSSREEVAEEIGPRFLGLILFHDTDKRKFNTLQLCNNASCLERDEKLCFGRNQESGTQKAEVGLRSSATSRGLGGYEVIILDECVRTCERTHMSRVHLITTFLVRLVDVEITNPLNGTSGPKMRLAVGNQQKADSGTREGDWRRRLEQLVVAQACSTAGAGRHTLFLSAPSIGLR